MRYVLLKDSIIVSIGEGEEIIPSTDERFERLKDLVKEDNVIEIKKTLKIKREFKDKDFTTKDGLVLYKNIPLPSSVGDLFFYYQLEELPLKSFANLYLNNRNSDFVSLFSEIENLSAMPADDTGFVFLHEGGVKKIEGFYAFNKERNREIYELLKEKKNFDDVFNIYFPNGKKKLKKMVKNRFFRKNAINSKILALSALNGLVKEENIVKNFEFFNFLNFENKDVFLEAFGHLTEQAIINLVKKKDFHHLLLCLNSLGNETKNRVLLRVKALKTNSIETISNIIKEERLFANKKNFSLCQESHYPKLKEVRGESLDIEIPQTWFDLIVYGDCLSFCVGNVDYANRAKKGEVFILGIYNNKKLTYVLEVENGKVKQFYNKANSTKIMLSRKTSHVKHREEVLGELKSKGLIF